MALVLAVVVPAPLRAAAAVVVRTADLRADRFVDATALRQVDIGTPVAIVQIDAGWVKVKVDGMTGWVRATSLSGEGAANGAVARLDSGRSAPNNVVVAAGIRRIPKGSRLALVIGVDAVAAPGHDGARWPGVADDIESARLLAQAMGVPADNVDVVFGDAATRGGIAAALERLDHRVQPGDEVFIYFSGPGTLVRDDAASNACSGAWISAEGQPLTAATLATQLVPLFGKAGKVLIVSDAAFASLPADRALPAQYTRKFAAAAGASGCAGTAGDFNLAAAALRGGAPASNLVQVQSAPGLLQGIDQARAGGLFTQRWLDCTLGDARASDGSGFGSVAATAACVDTAGAATNAPAHATAQPVMAMVSGNGGFAPVPLAPANRLTQNAATVATGRDPLPGSDMQLPRAALAALLAQRDGRIQVKVAATPAMLKVGKDYLDLQVQSSHAGYVYVVLLGSDQSSFYLLFPNDLDRDNHIAAGETLRLPRAQWRVQAQGPAGTDTVLAVVAESARDLALLDGAKSGPFSTLLTDTAGRARLQWLLGRSNVADTERCLAAGPRRNLAAVQACSDAFGAAGIAVTEY